MNSLIFNVLVKLLKPLVWLIALGLLVRGHDHLGGGFAAGIVASLAPILQILSAGWPSLRSWHRENIFAILGSGLLVAILSGVRGVGNGAAFMVARWWPGSRFGFGTPTLFDFGIAVVVYAVVVICVAQLVESRDEGSVRAS